MPIFEKVDDTNDGKQMAQFSHLSFQELMAGEYAAAIVHHSSANSTADAYVSFFLSSCSKSLERDRLSVAWWVQVWMHVCEMLSPSALQDWCRVLCQDEQSKLKVGRTIRAPNLSFRDRKVVSIDWDEGGCSSRYKDQHLARRGASGLSCHILMLMNGTRTG